MVVCFQSTPASVGRSLWNRSCADRNCSRRAIVPLGTDTLIANILVQICFSILSVCRPHQASHAHFRHRQPCGFNNSNHSTSATKMIAYSTNLYHYLCTILSTLGAIRLIYALSIRKRHVLRVERLASFEMTQKVTQDHRKWRCSVVSKK